MSTSPLTNVTDSVSGAWSSGSGTVHDLAVAAADLATDVASAAAGQLEDLPDKVAGLASAAKGRISPAPRRSWRPWLLVLAALATFVAVAWWLRRRSEAEPADSYGADRPTSSTTPAERAAAGN